MPIEAVAQDGRRRGCGRGPSHDDEIEARQLWLETKRFASQALEPVAIDGTLRCAARDRQTEPRVGAFVAACQHREVAIRGAHRIGEHAAELRGGQETFVNGKR